MSQFKRLGMGLGALIGGESEPAAATATKPAPDAVSTMEINTIRPNPYQPRTEFDPKEIESLAESLKKDGLLQPVVVRPAGAGFFQLVDQLGMGRPTVANFIRLLDLPLEVQEAVSRNTITMGHARALLAIAQRGT